jgi:two-component system, LytTR family, response regulator AlgR
MNIAAPLSVLIVDDEPLARLRIRSLVESLAAEGQAPPAQVVAEAEDATQALAVLSAGRFDLVLLDIQLPGRDGLRLAQDLRAQLLAHAPVVVFVTAHAGHALRAFELDAADYLTKPVRRERLAEALGRAAQRRAARAAPAAESPALAPSLVVTQRDRVLRLPVSEVLYLKAELKYVTVRTASESYLIDESLVEIEQRLGEAFVRVHRNALVARHAVRALELRNAGDDEGGEGWAVQVAGGEWLAVSRRQVAALRQVMEARPR